MIVSKGRHVWAMRVDTRVPVCTVQHTGSPVSIAHATREGSDSTKAFRSTERGTLSQVLTAFVGVRRTTPLKVACAFHEPRNSDFATCSKCIFESMLFLALCSQDWGHGIGSSFAIENHPVGMAGVWMTL